ncbi:MAG TPA: hypothetical protein V6C57_02545 [Coleofasciculaceae cyanobacterium]
MSLRQRQFRALDDRLPIPDRLIQPSIMNYCLGIVLVGCLGRLP